MSRVAVFLGRAAEGLGTIAPGEEVAFRFNGVEAPNGDVFSAGESEVWAEEVGMLGPPDVDSPVNLGLWNDTLAALGPNGRTPRDRHRRGLDDRLHAARRCLGRRRAGWSLRGHRPRRRRRRSRRHRRPRRRPTGRSSAASTASSSPTTTSPINVDGMVWRFALPAGAAGPLQLDVPAYLPRIDVWDGTRWVPVDDQLEDDRPFDPFSVDMTRTRPVTVPPGAVIDGTVWVRGWVAIEGPPVIDGVGLELRTPPRTVG